MIEEKMLILLRQGKVSKWFAGIGQEAIAVGCAQAMRSDEFILPMHRNLGVFTSRNVPLEKLFAQFQGKKSGFTKGRDRSFHFGSSEHHIVGMISHLGAQMGVADGIALGELLDQEQKACLVFSGDGGTSEGDFHESMNVAAVWNLPVLFVVENNGYGLSTPSSEQFRCAHLLDKAIGYGMEAVQLDGNNVLEVHQKLSELAISVRAFPRPILVECLTFRMRGHEEASGTKYVPDELMETWGLKDPVVNYESFLLQHGILSEQARQEIREQFKSEIDQALEIAFKEDIAEANTAEEFQDLFAKHDFIEQKEEGEKKDMRMIDSIHQALDLAMEKHKNLVLMGQDIAEYGGVFKATEGLMEKYGKARVRNTPLCEAAIVGASLGLSVKGYKSMMEMQFADFVTEGFNQIVNNLAKIHWRWGQNADVVVRMPTGAGVAAGPFHSQSNEAWFTHVPGLKVVYPSSAADAKGLLLASFEDPNPVMFFEHKALYRSTSEAVSQGYYTTPIGKAKRIREGDKLSIITYGMGVHWALDYLDEHGLSADLIDLRSLQPIDWDTVYESVRKCGRVLVLHEDNLFGGIGGEIASTIMENCFESLDAPVKRLASLDTPVPFAKSLEDNYLPVTRLEAAIQEILSY